MRFHCTAANASSVAWSIDGLIRYGNELKVRGIATMTNHVLLESNLTISSALENNNTHLRCLARHHVDHRFISSDEAIFYIQGQLPFTTYQLIRNLTLPCSAGVLRKCHALRITPLGNYHQRLTWDPPSTLNITIVEPDISSYIVCSNLSIECTTIDITEAGGDDLRQYRFLNLRAYIKFTVTAVNIVGDGESTSIVYEPCEYPGEGKYITMAFYW